MKNFKTYSLMQTPQPIAVLGFMVNTATAKFSQAIMTVPSPISNLPYLILITLLALDFVIASLNL